MEKCVIFLDEAHSRGTDLKPPATYRAEDIDKETLGCLINYIFLPHGLPNTPDVEIIDGHLLDVLILFWQASGRH
jgi:hypothetical protein